MKLLLLLLLLLLGNNRQGNQYMWMKLIVYRLFFGIQSFVPSIAVISSKQRPRKILIVGSDGNEHTFLLKGHEDLRQDERVMQLFGLTNALLANHRDTSKRDLAIFHLLDNFYKPLPNMNVDL